MVSEETIGNRFVSNCRWISPSPVSLIPMLVRIATVRRARRIQARRKGNRWRVGADASRPPANLPAILNPVQLQLIPRVVKTLINSQGPVRIRLFITGG
jgi:hypothetical protein